MKFEILFFERENGEQPVKQFLLSIDKKMRAKVADIISLLADNGNELREPYSKYLSDGIFELRVHIGSDTSRVLYFFYAGQKIILTNGFIKKTQKVPMSELEKAKRYRREYFERKGNEKAK